MVKTSIKQLLLRLYCDFLFIILRTLSILPKNHSIQFNI
jgi:hypothetical protein